MAGKAQRDSGDGVKLRGNRFYAYFHVTGDDGRRKLKGQALDPAITGKKEAKAARAAIMAEVRGGRYVAPSRRTVGEWLTTWVASAAIGSKTRDTYRMLIEAHLARELGSIPLDRL